MAAPCVEVNITTKDGKSSKFSESVTDMRGNITLPVLHQVLKKMQLEVNSSLTILVETAKKNEARPKAVIGVGDNANVSDIDDLDEDSEEDEADERRPEKRKSNEELGSQKVAKVT